MLNLKEVLEYKLQLGHNAVNIAELLADRLILATALNDAIIALDEIKRGGLGAHQSAILATNILGSMAHSIDFKKESK